MLLDFVPEAARALKAFDIFFLPSRKEGLPYVLLEAGEAGLAVVASDVGGIPDVITAGTGLLRHPADAQGFADALYECAKSPDARARFGESLRRRVLSDFSFERMLSATTSLYR